MAAIGDIQQNQGNVGKKEVIIETTNPKNNKVKLLLVEDSIDNRHLINAYLKGLNWEIDIAEHGAIAVEKFKENKYDVILMDIQMPVMDGYTATKEIRKIEQQEGKKETPIIALTVLML
ncbi:response regulator [Alkalihalobacterium alkalinitrilicum]|uniref:response regulator n=1 Tax=Alkalihalobacterium alkalinitrilicum TaxID=427920 RepID=UPI001C562385|nr:response regulator [Alkalihalobacterium alkalinitrilicum]